MWYVVWDIPRAMESKVSFRISPSIKREGVAAKATGRPALGVFRSHRDAEAEDGAALYLQARADDEDKDPTSPGEALKMAIPGAMVESTASTFERYRDAGCERAEAGDMSAAIAAWNKALELCPDDYLVLEMKAQALLLELRLIDASRAAQRVVALAPHWAEGFVTLARVHRELGEVALALAAYDEAVRLDSAGVGVDEEVIEERREMRRFVELTEAHVCAVQSQREIQQQSPTSLGPTGDGVAAPIAIPSHIPSHLHDEVLCCMQQLQSRVKVGRREVQS